MNILILIGPPGSGKGTLAKSLAEDGWKPLSTGELLRSAAQNDPALAQQLASGTLTDDDTITRLLRNALDAEKQVLLDGYPRNAAQVDRLAVAFPHANIRALELRLPDETALRRIAGREQDGGRPEDRPDIAVQRLQLFHQQTQPAIRRYENAGTLRSVSAAGTPEEVLGTAKVAVAALFPELTPG